MEQAGAPKVKQTNEQFLSTSNWAINRPFEHSVLAIFCVLVNYGTAGQINIIWVSFNRFYCSSPTARSIHFKSKRREKNSHSLVLYVPCPRKNRECDRGTSKSVSINYFSVCVGTKDSFRVLSELHNDKFHVHSATGNIISRKSHITILLRCFTVIIADVGSRSSCYSNAHRCSGRSTAC